MASIQSSCVCKTSGESLNQQPEPTRLSLFYAAPSRIGFYYSLLKIGFLRSSAMETRTALLHVVAPLSELIAGKSIGLNRLALPLRRLRIMPSTECSTEANDGAKNAAPLGLEKPLQSYADKYPALLMGFSLIMWVSGT